MAIYQYSFPTRIHFGPGAIGLLPAALRDAGARKPLVVTDRGLAALPMIRDIQGSLASGGLEPAVFGGVAGNPVKSQVTAGVEAYRRHGADAVVAVGGGAALDVGKAIALMVHHPGDLFDYEDEKPGARPIDRDLPVFMTVPTTAGTGSEVGRSTVISDDETKAKKIIFSPRLLAVRVFADPNLTAGLPASVTAATGMDALTHLVESYLAKGSQPLCDGIALEGLRLLARGLRPAVSFARRIEGGATELLGAPEHIAARGDMLNAALMGGVAFQKGLGVTHSMAHALSTVRDLHHGLANGIVIPYAMEFNRDAVGDRLAMLADVVRAPEATAEAFLNWLRTLRAAIGIPATLGEVGVRASDLDRLIEVAVADACHQNNPKPVSPDDFRALFRAALAQ
jgi:hypothetical protein